MGPKVGAEHCFPRMSSEGLEWMKPVLEATPWAGVAP